METECLVDEHMSFEEYLGLNALSASGLSLLRRSPAHFKYAKDNPPAETDAFQIGSAAHCATLEPERWEREYVCAPKFDRRTKEGKAGYAEFLAQHEGKTPLPHDTYEAAQGMAYAIRSHARAKAMLDGAMAEVSLLWRDQRNGVRCKARFDAYNYKLGLILDIKTTEIASPWKFSRTIFDFGYYRKAAWYAKAAQYAKLPFKHFVFIAVEKRAPYCVSVFRLENEVIELGMKENESLVDLYKNCTTHDEWPGYDPNVQDISLPKWALNDLEETYGRNNNTNTSSDEVEF